MKIDLTTPALLFPAISLLLLAYTNRFLTTGQLIRQLKNSETGDNTGSINKQIDNLKTRIDLIILMQATGVASILFCTTSMITLFFEIFWLGYLSFGLSLFLMILSLFFSLWEVMISGRALNIELRELKIDSN